MYQITNIVIINGEKATIENVKGGFFPTLTQVNDYQRVMSDYFNLGKRHKLTVFVDYKIKIEKHIPWPKCSCRKEWLTPTAL